MADNEIYTRVLKLMREKAAHVEDVDASRPLVLLGEDGMFDSVTALELVLAIEQEFQIVVKDDDVKPENLGTVDSIVRFVQTKLARQARTLALIFQPMSYVSILGVLPWGS